MRAHVCISLPVEENCYALQNIWHFDGIKENEMTAVSGLRCDRMTLLKFIEGICAAMAQRMEMKE